MKPNYNRYYQRFNHWTRQPVAKVSGLVSLTIFTVSFFCFFAILPTFKTITQLKKEIKDAQEVNSQLYKKTVSLATAQNNYEKIINQLPLINQTLPEKEKFETLAWQLSWLASQKGVQLSNGVFGSFPLVGQLAKPELNTIQIELGLIGNYLQIKSFIETLTNLDRLITVQDLNFGSKNLQVLKNSGQLNANLKLTAFFLPQETK